MFSFRHGHRFPSTVRHVRDGAVLLEVDIQTVGLVVFCYHHAGLNDARLLGEVSLAEGLEVARWESVYSPRHCSRLSGLTVSLLSCSDSFLPTSLLLHSSVLLELPTSPGTMRGIVTMVFRCC